VRLAIISDAFPPMKTSGAVQIRDLSRELADSGHIPCVITPDPNLSESYKFTEERGVRILRVRTLPTKDVAYVYRALAEFLTPFIIIVRARKFLRAERAYDGIIWYSPNIFFGPLVWALKRRFRCRSYLILRDIFPQWALDAGILNRGAAYSWLKLNERFQYSVADSIGVQSKSNLPYLSWWSRQGERRLEVFNNWLAENKLPDNVECTFMDDFESKTVVAYTGNMGVAQGMDSIIDLAISFLDRRDVIFLLVGRGSEVDRLKSVARARNIHNIKFVDEIPPEEIPLLLGKCDIGLVLLDSRHKTHNIPGKLMAYLQVGIPILARVNSGNDLKDLIVDTDVGRVSDGKEPMSLFTAHASELIDNSNLRSSMGSRGKQLALEQFSSTAAAARLVEYFENYS
jgi:glycosyltransferase involved in cell wall biosynthesis